MHQDKKRLSRALTQVNDTSRPPQETIIEVKAVFNVDVNVL